jgi:MerR family redox-sensitive transcriptional activator SoxR
MKNIPLHPSGLPAALSVGELARRSGVPVSTLHFYEAQGLIAGWRTDGNQRRYARDVLRRVALIRTAQAVGISLADVAAALASLPPDGARRRAPTGRGCRPAGARSSTRASRS